MLHLALTVKSDTDKVVAQQPEYLLAGLEMKGSFGQHRLARQHWPPDLLRDLRRPIVILVVFPRQSNQKTGVGDGLHRREKPFRVETSRGPPLMMPTYFLQASFLLAGASCERPFSTNWRTTRPTGSPVSRAFSRRRSRSSCGSRMLSVLPIRQDCNTNASRLGSPPNY